MLANIISIGDEILIGQIVNTNASWISKRLNSIGISVSRIISVADSEEAILNVFNESLSNCQLVLITGGLGPTSDDITKPALYKFFGSKPVFHPEVYEHIQKLFSNRGLVIGESNQLQSVTADNCIVLHNEHGTAPGMWFEKEGVIFVSMPGVPFEMEAIMNNEVIPRLKSMSNLPAIVHKTIMTTGIGESALSDLIKEWEQKIPVHIKLAYLPSVGIVRLRLSATGTDENQLKSEIDNILPELKSIAKQYIYSENDESIDYVVSRILKEKKLTLSIAESCTGGNISHLITMHEGCSAFFKGSIVAYSNSIKMEILKVPGYILEQNGAVSRETVEIMAKNCREVFNTDFAIAVSGIAGPEGGTPEKPVGTIWVAVASSQKVTSILIKGGNHRGRNITRASIGALDLLLKNI